ncbi:MAG: CvpA family protein [Anaerolineales bacterium]|nr:CvpA family protein [Anaerolineales bacterium]
MDLTYLQVLVAGGFVFGLMGFLRGVAREVITAMGIIIAYAFIKWGESLLVRWTNKFHKLVVFAAKGGLAADDPTAIWPQVANLPPFIETDADKLVFRLIVFISLVSVAYIVGNRVLSGRAATFGPLAIYPDLSPLSRFLGLATGLMEGYLIAYFVIPEVFPKAETVVKLPTGTVTVFLGQYVALVLVGFLAVLIAFGLRSASLKK